MTSYSLVVVTSGFEQYIDCNSMAELSQIKNVKILVRRRLDKSQDSTVQFEPTMEKRTGLDRIAKFGPQKCN
jgi:hypothetical protein